MLKSFMCFLLLVASFSAIAQDDQKGLARVQKIQGVECYFMSEPLRPYEVVLDKGTGFKATSLLTGGLVNEGISAKASQFVKRIIKEAQNNNVDIDAVIYTNGKRAVGVRFTDEPTEENNGIARVHKIEGVEIYVLAEPLRNYRVISNKGGGMKMKSLVTAGVVNNSIETDITKMVRKLQKSTRKVGGIDAIVYGAGKKASGAQFK